jgi:uncharacterized SAM-dependent methyltransferase
MCNQLVLRGGPCITPLSPMRGTYRNLFPSRPRSRMEMYLRSTRSQTISIELPGLQVTFAKGERIHTENSYKYTHAMVRSLLQDGGFELEHTWTDRRKWFALHLARVTA